MRTQVDQIKARAGETAKRVDGIDKGTKRKWGGFIGISFAPF